MRSIPRILLGAFLPLLVFASSLFADPLGSKLSALAPSLSPKILSLALKASHCAVSRGKIQEKPLLAVIDYSLPSTAERFWVFDTHHERLLWHELVSHGKNSGENYASEFSNRLGSLQSSLGLFRTGESYVGKNGYSMRLYGLEPGINNLAFERTIVLHGAPYVSEEFLERHGRLGRSWGCPAIPTDVTSAVIDTLENSAFLFIYYPDPNWEKESVFLGDCG